MVPSYAMVFFFFLLLNFTGEAQNTSSPTQSANVPEPSQCAKEYINEHMQITADQSKEFLMQELRKRLNDRSTVDAERKCLMLCFQAYTNAGESMAKGAIDVSQNNYIEAVKEVVKYSRAIAPCLQCSTQNLLNDAELMHFQKLAKTNGEDLLQKLQSCH